jgi:hypothetical protein
MPFRDPISFLVLPPGATPPVVGLTAILLDPGPPPIIEFYTGDSDEGSPGFVQGNSGSGILPAGSLWLWLSSPFRDDSGTGSAIILKTGGDAAPNDAAIDIDTGLLDIDADVELRSGNNLDILGGDLDILGGDATIRGGAVPHRRAQDVDTASSGNINTTETIIQTLTAAVVSGQTYKLTADFGYAVSDVTWIGLARIREDNAAGTVLQARRINAPTTASPWSYHMEAEFTASSTGNKTIVLTLQRTGGAGNITLAAGATQPSYFYMDYVRG